MDSKPREIEYYVTEDGKAPFTEWLNWLKDLQSKAKIRVRLDRVRLGNFGDHGPVGTGVSELRIDFGPGYRIYYGREGEKIVVLLIGGAKGTQSKDIQKAQEYWQNYRSRKNEN